MMNRRKIVLVLALGIAGGLAGGGAALAQTTIGPADPAVLVPPPGVYNATRMSGGRWDCAGGCSGIYCCVIRTVPT